MHLEVEGVVFDMDGLLIDSEPYWKAADLEVYGRLGIDLSQQFKNETTGLRVDAAVRHWFDKFPWTGKSLEDVGLEIVAFVAASIRREGKAMAGAEKLVKGLHAAKIPLAVCSSSPLALIETAMTTLGLKPYFDILYSAEAEPNGKPHPGAYLSTAQRMGIDPTKLLVFEDSLLGAIAAKAARMRVVAVLESHNHGNSRFDFCDLTLHSLEEFDAASFLADRNIVSTESLHRRTISGRGGAATP